MPKTSTFLWPTTNLSYYLSFRVLVLSLKSLVYSFIYATTYPLYKACLEGASSFKESRDQLPGRPNCEPVWPSGKALGW